MIFSLVGREEMTGMQDEMTGIKDREQYLGVILNNILILIIARQNIWKEYIER